MKASAASLFSLVLVAVQVGASNYFGNRIKVNKQSTTLSALLVRGGESNAGKDDPDTSIPHFETFSFESDNDISDPYSESQDLSDSASILASSLLYEGGCFVSSQAMMCNGGGDTVIESLINKFDSDEDFSDEEDEDDDDDGHSSMLSNASVRRSKALANGSIIRPKENKQPAQSASGASYFEGEVRLNEQCGFVGAFGVVLHEC